jgi:hypothetical protein
MSLLEQAKDLYVRLRDMDWQGRRDALKEVPEAIAEAYHAYRKDRMYDPENAQPNPKEFLSPSGKYKLVVTSFTSGPNTWNVTEGKVFTVDSDTPIASIRRNYSAFPYCFVERHANGHDYLIGGEDYQGQTVIELDTGKKRGLLPEEAKQGHGFCWSSYTYNAKAKVLFVDGCYWAAPYEFRFYDFSDPMNGWPLLEYVPADEEDGEAYVESDGKDPTFEEDGTIITYQTKFGKPGDDDDDEEEDAEGNKRERKVVATRTWKREGLKLKEIAFWVDPEEQAERDRRAEANRKWEEDLANYKKTDPLYLKLLELVAQEPFKPADWMSVGQTGAHWCPDFHAVEQRMCRTIHSAGTFRIELEIAAKTGPVKLIMSNSKVKCVERFFMEHSVESVEKAFAAAREFLAGDP